MKHSLLRLSVLALLLAITVVLFAAHEINGINYIIYEDKGFAEVTFKSPKYSGDIVIPSEIEYNGKKCTVKTIGASAFFYCDNLTSVTIPNTVTGIRYNAFGYCSKLTNIEIPNSVVTIGERCFEVSGITSIYIPNSVQSIEQYAFSNCKKLKSVYIGNSLHWFQENVFIGCDDIESLEYHSNLPIPWFYGKEKLTTLVVGDEVEYISGFSGCISLTNVTMGNSVSSIKSYAFQNCESLKNIELSNSLKEIGSSAFEGCKSLENIVIPNSVIKINNGVFAHCENLLSAKLSNSIETISATMFSGCKKLKEIIIPIGIKTIERSAFDQCESIETMTLPYTLISINDYAFDGCYNLKTVISYNPTPPSISNSTFDNYENKKLFVPKGSEDLYKNARGWWYFYQIEGIDVSNINSTFIDSESESSIYNLNGTKVDGNNYGKGIYIKNGKKVIIK